LSIVATKPETSASNAKMPKNPALRHIVLTSYIHRTKAGKCEGVCLTLNLVVRGNTMHDTEEKLRTLTTAYLLDAQKSGNWRDLVPRRAPLYYYAQYYYLVLLAHFDRLKDFKLFVESAPCTANA
jgi:hypothetical protein